MLAGCVVHHAEGRRRNKDYMLFVFGDSAHGNRPTGRVSDGMVQSDILGTFDLSNLQIKLISEIIDRRRRSIVNY